MKATRNPTRWADAGADAPPGLAAAIHDLRAERGTTQQVEELARRLAPQFASPPVASGGVTVQPWIKGVGTLLLSGAIGYYAFTLVPTPTPPLERPPASPAATTKAVASPPSTPAPSSPLPALVREQLPKAPAASKMRPVHVGGATAPPPRPAPESELALLQRSQAALDRDAAAALALAEEHARDYPNGLFTQEREILAIEALLKLRRRPTALARAEAFLERYPESPHSRRVRALLDRSHSLDPATIEGGGGHSQDVPMPRGSDHDPN